jgi:DNA mismatch repair protein MutS2
MVPAVPNPMDETSGGMLEFDRLREMVASYAGTAPGREWTLALLPSRDREWAAAEQRAAEEALLWLRGGNGFDFHGLIDPAPLLERARLVGAVLEVEELLALSVLAGRLRAFQEWIGNLPTKAGPSASSAAADEVYPERSRRGRDDNFAGTLLQLRAAPLLEARFGGLIEAIDGKFEPDGSVADHASPELARIRRRIERQQQAIQQSLHAMLRQLGPEGSLQEDLITVRGERFVLPVKAEWKRRVPGVLHGASSSGQTFFIEPLETIDQNNDLQRLMEDEHAEVQRILAEMTRQVAAHSDSIAAGAAALAEMDSLFGRARFAQEFQCIAPVFSEKDENRILMRGARHPLLEKRLREDSHAENSQRQTVVPLDLELPADARELVISGPNTGGKTVALKTVGLLALMAQSGIPVPAEAAELPVFDAVLADIGDAQSIAQNLSTFSAHIARVNRISLGATEHSLVLLDELGAATDPEEGAALAAAIAAQFVARRAWCLISTHHTSLKVYAENTPGVRNAAAGFDEQTFAPTYQIRIGVPGVSAGIHIAERLGLDAAIVANARERLGKQTEEIGKFLDRLHVELLAVNTERAEIHRREEELARELQKLEREGRDAQQRQLREMESKLGSLLKDFEYRVREVLRGIEDRAAQQQATKQAERGLATLRREFREQVNATVVAHRTGADKDDPNARPHIVRAVAVGDTVRLRSLGKNARVERQMDAENFEVSVGALKMRIRRDDVAEVVISAPERERQTPVAAARSKGIRVLVDAEKNHGATEINVIGRNVDEATDAVEKFLDQAFLEGMPRVRIVHGIGMGILRKALRAYLEKHPQVAAVTEAPQNEGGAGATLVELRQ